MNLRATLRAALRPLFFLYLLTPALLIAPHYLTYFNLLAGGPQNGHRYLVDSNLDWGQSFIALADYLDAHHIPEINLSYYTYTDPALYGIRYRPLPPARDAPVLLPRRFDPAPGVYVIGATTLQGVMLTDPDTYAWFRHRAPDARPGTALFLYRVPAHEPPTYLAQCLLPTAPLTAEAAVEGFGQDDLRMAYFDCGAAWLYPQGGGPSGRYALFRETATGDDPFIRRHLAGMRLTFERRHGGALPPFAIYEQTAPVRPPHLLVPPVRFDHLTLLGYDLIPGPTVEIETWWRIESLPGRPLSLMLHLNGPGGFAVVGDGLGVGLDQWQTGDLIVQRHVLPLPEDAPPGEYRPEVGVYWLDTLERWRTAGGEEGVFLPPVNGG